MDELDACIEENIVDVDVVEDVVEDVVDVVEDDVVGIGIVVWFDAPDLELIVLVVTIATAAIRIISSRTFIAATMVDFFSINLDKNPFKSVISYLIGFYSLYNFYST